VTAPVGRDPPLRLLGWWSRRSPFSIYALRRVVLIPAQLLLVLFVLFTARTLPAGVAHALPGGAAYYFHGFFQSFYYFAGNLLVGNWGSTSLPNAGYAPPTSWGAYLILLLPPTVQLAVFALPIAAAVAYPVSLLAGWSRRAGIDPPARVLTLVGALVPSFFVGILVLNLVFFPFESTFQDIPSQGLIPSFGWFVVHGGYPSWIRYQSVTRPTGFPLVDALIHHAWSIAEISLVKTLIQASVVAAAYIGVFFRHARSAVRSVRDEPHIVGARAWGIPERTILWRHAARRVTPSFLWIFALTTPEFVGILFSVEIAFGDQTGFGWLLFYYLGNLKVIDALVFVLAVAVLLWALGVDLVAVRLDPRGALAR
jgi:ABC-type dipeptide/oligopeptide/nickel transport system permease component